MADSIDRQVRRFQARPESERRQEPRSTSTRTGAPSRIDVMGGDGSKGSSAPASATSRTRADLRPDRGMDLQGEQWRHVEQRGHRGFCECQGEPKYGRPVSGTARVDVWNSNDFEIELSGNTILIFDATAGDYARGSARGNIRLQTRTWFTIEVIHNGHELRFPNGIRWQNGERPDMTPIEGGSYVMGFYITRKGRGDQATERVVCTGFQQVAQTEPADGEA